MQRYIIRRLINMASLLVGLTLAVFLMMRVIPGDVAALMLEGSPTAKRIDELRRQPDIDKPMPQ